MRFRERLSQVLREPLVHFLLAGLAIFLFFGIVGDDVNVGDRRIVVKEDQVRRLAIQWEQTWQRPPRPSELDGLIRDFIKEEIYYREALHLGLDKDDVIIRRRLRSKMEFLAASENETLLPSTADLQAWLDKYPERYASDPVFDVDQIYVSLAGGRLAATARAEALLEKLQEGTNPDDLGDPISLPRSLDAASLFDINRQFGETFSNAVKSAPTGKWSGPFASGFGLHLVRIRSVQAAHRPKLTDVRQAVENDWRFASRETREARAYQALLDGYQIEIEKLK